MYHRGTFSEFNTWHNGAKVAEGLPKVGYVNNVSAPFNQQTTAYSLSVQNPNKSDDYIWQYGAYRDSNKTILLQSDIDNLNWFPGVA